MQRDQLPSSRRVRRRNAMLSSNMHAATRSLSDSGGTLGLQKKRPAGGLEFPESRTSISIRRAHP